MSHVTKDDKVLVDWTTGDPEGDRAYLFEAYREFLREVRQCNGREEIEACFKRWKVDELNVDDFPRISIEYPVESI